MYSPLFQHEPLEAVSASVLVETLHILELSCKTMNCLCLALKVIHVKIKNILFSVLTFCDAGAKNNM